MFERYTEKTRRVIFCARYEASQLGSLYIETEHLLLGLFREDKALTSRFFGSPGTPEAIRREIEQHTTKREKDPTSVDLPLSNEAKRVLSFSAEEAEQLSHKHIGSEHLLLGLLQEKKGFAAKLLHDRGIQLEPVREELKKFPHQLPESLERGRPHSFRFRFGRDAVHAVDERQPLIGREDELERLICVLCRRTRNNPVLVGEPGVGKKTIVGGLAQRMTNGTVPTVLARKSMLALDLPPVGTVEKEHAWFRDFREALAVEGAIFFVDDLHTPANASAWTGSLHIEEILKPLVMRGQIQCITTATPDGYPRSIENQGWLEQYFQPVDVAPASEADAIKILLGIKDEYEMFHGVTYTEDALNYAVYYASCCIRGRGLPGKAVDVIDEAAAGVGMHHSVLPHEVVELRKRIKFIVHRIKGAVVNHELEKARFYEDEERKERENMCLLREKYKLDDTVVSTVTREHIENVVSRWTGAPVGSIRQALANSKKPRL
jgi:ATP-dependent Clp protease ATP-binding subunit ClpC